jgi:hypothetical protein
MIFKDKDSPCETRKEAFKTLFHIEGSRFNVPTEEYRVVKWQTGYAVVTPHSILNYCAIASANSDRRTKWILQKN